MESSTIIVFLCLSAACLVSCQLPECPEDVLNNRSKYYSYSYLPNSDTVLRQCIYVIRTGYLGYYFGPPRTVRRTYYDCAEGLTHLLISDVGRTPLYTCEEDAEVVPDETDAPVETTDEPATESVVDNTDTPTAERPTTAEPTTGGVIDCPRGSFQTSSYVYSSLALIEPVQCVVRATSNG